MSKFLLEYDFIYSEYLESMKTDIERLTLMLVVFHGDLKKMLGSEVTKKIMERITQEENPQDIKN